jgi:hypothetical protein
MAREQDIRRAREALVRERIQHERRSGNSNPDTRKIEGWASETARRNDRRDSDRK